MKKNKKQTKESCELCGEVSCCSPRKQKDLKIYFCPKCRSKDVGFIFTFRNIFGIIPKMRCRKCGFESIVFPQLSISRDKLNKLDKRRKK